MTPRPDSSPAGADTPSKGDLTRQRILETGHRLVLDQGFAALGLSQLLREAGVPKGSFYYYFASKEAFGVTLLEDYVTTYLSRVDCVISTPGNAAARLSHMFRAALEVEGSAQMPGAMASRCLVVRLGAEVAALSPDMARVLNRGVSSLTDRLSQVFEDGARDGSLRPQPDPRAAASMLYAQWLGAAILARLSHSPVPLQTAYDETLRRFAI